MSAPSPILLIFGSGPRIGHHVGQAFSAKGYKIALASRSAKEEASTPSQLNISTDLSDPSSVTKAFAKVKASLGFPPSVVVYNAGAVTPNDAKNPFSLPLEGLSKDLNINTISAFIAAQQATLGFEQLPDTAAKTFIYTGNILNTPTIIPPLMSLGVGKSATAHMINVAAAAYKDRGYKFYYADERKTDGSPAFMDLDGPAHAEIYLKLAEGKGQQAWQQTFVKGEGYKQF